MSATTTVQAMNSIGAEILAVGDDEYRREVLETYKQDLGKIAVHRGDGDYAELPGVPTDGTEIERHAARYVALRDLFEHAGKEAEDTVGNMLVAAGEFIMTRRAETLSDVLTQVTLAKLDMDGDGATDVAIADREERMRWLIDSILPVLAAMADSPLSGKFPALNNGNAGSR